MGKFFDQLPEPWQKVLQAGIDKMRSDYPAVAEQYREDEAEALLGCELSDTPGDDEQDEFANNFLNYEEGWRAAIENLPQLDLTEVTRRANELIKQKFPMLHEALPPGYIQYIYQAMKEIALNERQPA